MPDKTKEIKITINGKVYKATKGESLLEVCQKNDILIATLCKHPDFEKSEAVCRLCLVKVSENKDKDNFRLVPSCAFKVGARMKIITEDFEIARVRKTILELLFMEHAGFCHNCYRNLNCELQTLALKYSIDELRFVPRVAEMESDEAMERLRDRLSRKVIDIKNPSIARDSSKCVECRRCVKVCSEIQGIKALGVNKRGIQMGVGTEHHTPLECTYCGQCSSHCPTAAIIEKSEMIPVVRALKAKNKVVIAQTAPSVRFTLGEEFGMIPGSVVTGKMVAALRKCGFDKVFDVVTGADFTILEEATELIGRIQNENRRHPLPMFTSCCPAWVLFCEQHFPELIPNLSSTRSPQMMMGSLIKNYYAKKIKTDPKDIVVVSIMPCTAKKYEASRPEFSHNKLRDVDYVLTVREIAHIIKNLNIPFMDLPEENFDPAFGASTGSGVIFGATGGVAEAAFRTAHFYLTGKSFPHLELRELRGEKGIREASIRLGNKKINVALVSGLGNARKVAEMAYAGKLPYHFVEVMACPGGCIAGGGQPLPISDEIRQTRTKSIYLTDKKLPIRESHKNPVVEEVYKDFLYTPGSRKAEKLLHTKHYPFEYKLRKEHMGSTNQ